jgi:hypothetical protein
MTLALPGSAGSAKNPPAKNRNMEIRRAAAALYGQSYNRRRVAVVLLDHLVPVEGTNGRKRLKKERMRAALRKLRGFEREVAFRDMIYEAALLKVDMELPEVLEGMTKKAKTRVDAARLVLEVTGRHNPRGEQQAPNITVQIANLPRPE